MEPCPLAWTQSPRRGRGRTSSADHGRGLPHLCGVAKAGGRGRKSEATKAAEKASLAKWLAQKYGAEGSRLARQAVEREAARVDSGAADDVDVQVLGEVTVDDRNEAGFAAAMDLDEAAA